MTEPQPKPLNKVEVWVADHALPIFLAIAVAIIIGAAGVFWTWQKQGDTAHEVHVLEPQVTKINHAICDSGSLVDDRRARACAERIRIGLINCRRSTRCRAAYLALATFPTAPAHHHATSSPPQASSGSPGDTGGGDAHQQPSHHGHQQPGPGKGPEPPAEPSPASPPGSGGAGGGEQAPPAQTPGNGPPAESGKSGVDVEACVLEKTCVGVELGP